MKNISYFAKNILVVFAISLLVSVSAFAKPKLSQPILGVGSVGTDYIDITVTGGATGAPAGFSLQWMLLSDYNLYGWDGPNSDSHLCKASFSGNASGYYYNLAPGQTVTVRVGKLDFSIPGGSTSSDCEKVLDCDTAYVFRSFAHATSSQLRSDWSYLANPVKTLPCGPPPPEGCTYTQGYWKNHGPHPTGNNSNVWPVPGLNLGNPPTFYVQLQLQAIFETPVGGNGLISLSHQLIAAKLNIANGANPAALGTAVTDADNLIGPLVVPPVGGGYLAPGDTSGLTGVLDAFNSGLIGPGHCK
jgi:hypothetical protein